MPDTQTLESQPTELNNDEVLDLVADAPAGLLQAIDAGTPGFIIDEGLAAWVVDKFISYDERLARLKAQYQSMLKSLESDQARFERRFLPELELYFKANPPKKGKSLKMLTGTIGVRTVKGGARIRDEEAAREWAMEGLPEAIAPRTVFDLDKDALRQHALTTGEVIPGLEITLDEERFYVKAQKGGVE